MLMINDVLCLQDSFRYFSGRTTTSAFRGRNDRYVFLFQRLFFVTKKEEDGGFQYKMHVQVSRWGQEVWSMGCGVYSADL